MSITGFEVKGQKFGPHESLKAQEYAAQLGREFEFDGVRYGSLEDANAARHDLREHWQSKLHKAKDAQAKKLAAAAELKDRLSRTPASDPVYVQFENAAMSLEGEAAEIQGQINELQNSLQAEITEVHAFIPVKVLGRKTTKDIPYPSTVPTRSAYGAGAITAAEKRHGFSRAQRDAIARQIAAQPHWEAAVSNLPDWLAKLPDSDRRVLLSMVSRSCVEEIDNVKPPSWATDASMKRLYRCQFVTSPSRHAWLRLTSELRKEASAYCQTVQARQIKIEIEDGQGGRGTYEINADLVEHFIKAAGVSMKDIERERDRANAKPARSVTGQSRKSCGHT